MVYVCSIQLLQLLFGFSSSSSSILISYVLYVNLLNYLNRKQINSHLHENYLHVVYDKINFLLSNCFSKKRKRK